MKVALSLFASLLFAAPAFAEFTCELSFPQAPSTALANFPVLVRLAENAPTGFSYTDCPTGDCLWFTDANNNSLPFEVDTWDTDGESLVWVSVPSLSDAATITMHWDASHEETSRASEVWSLADYVGVWHMNELLTDGTGTYTPDSSASGWNAYKKVEADAIPAPVTTASVITAHPTPLTGTAMNIANGAGKGDNTLGGFLVPSNATSSTTLNGPGFTLSAIVNAQQNAGNRARAITFGSAHNDNANLTVGKDQIYVMGSNWHNKPHSKGATDWVYAAGVFSSPKSKIYADGVCLSGDSDGNPNLASLTLAKGIGLGCLTGGNNTHDGYLDEIRIRSVASDATWITNEYATVTDAAYISFGTVEKTGGGTAALEFATPLVSSVSAMGATISSRLKGLGENADSANLWLVVTGFGQTRTYPLAAATGAQVVEATATGLQPGAEWAAYLTATNNASPAVGADSASVTFSTLSDAGAGSPGLYQDVTHTQATAQDAAANWDIAASDVVTLGPLAMRSSGNNHDAWQSVDGTPFTWADSTGFGYAGYMYMEGGKDYYFGASADDAGYVWVNNGASNWDAKRTATQFGSYGNWKAAGPYAIAETGYYRVVFASWNGSGGAGAEPTASVSYPKMRYIALESGASTPTANTEGWQEAVDPGDGSVFIAEAPTRTVSVISAVRDGTLLSAKVALGEVFPGESSVLRYVYGATNGGNDPADWEGGSLVASSLPATAVTNDYLVGIAADTRYVRFYTQDGDAVTWSATISLDWAGEGSVAGGFIFLGDPDVSSVMADSAVLSAVLNAPGDNATEAQAWFVVTGGGETKVVPAGTATVRTNLTVTVTGLTPEREYTFYATATNNAATPAGADSASGVFATGNGTSAWDAAGATFKQDGRTLKATVDVTNLGVGTTTLYLMTGTAWNSENTVSASQVITSPGKQTIIGDFSDRPWGGNKVYYSLMLVNGTAESATTNWPNASGQAFYNKSMELRDESTYTWIGGSVGMWNDDANWEITVVSSIAPTQTAGYPVLGSTAIFATAQGDGPITVTVPATQGATIYSNERCWIVNNLNLSGMHEELVIKSEDKTAADCRFYVWQVTANQTYNRLVFDDCNVYLNGIKDAGASSADANGENFAITFTGGTTAQFNSIDINRPGFTIRAEDGATVTCGNGGGGVGTVIEIDNATYSGNRIEADTNGADNKDGMLIRLLGANPSFTVPYFQFKKATSTNAVEFVVPTGGYAAAPFKTSKNDAVFANGTGNSLIVRVSKDSPGLASIPGRGILLLQSAGGINAANVRFEDVKPSVNGFFFKDADGNKYADAAAIEAAGKTAAQITQIWYRSPARPLCIIVR